MEDVIGNRELLECIINKMDVNTLFAFRMTSKLNKEYSQSKFKAEFRNWLCAKSMEELRNEYVKLILKRSYSD